MREIIGFDTFEGFPAASCSAEPSGSTSVHIQPGRFADDSKAELEEVAKIHEGYRFLDRRPQIRLVKGDACETIPKCA